MRAECPKALMRRPMQSQNLKLMKIKAAGSILAAVVDPQFSGGAFL